MACGLRRLTTCPPASSLAGPTADDQAAAAACVSSACVRPRPRWRRWNLDPDPECLSPGLAAADRWPGASCRVGVCLRVLLDRPRLKTVLPAAGRPGDGGDCGRWRDRLGLGWVPVCHRLERGRSATVLAAGCWKTSMGVRRRGRRAASPRRAAASEKHPSLAQPDGRRCTTPNPGENFDSPRCSPVSKPACPSSTHRSHQFGVRLRPRCFATPDRSHAPDVVLSTKLFLEWNRPVQTFQTPHPRDEDQVRYQRDDRSLMARWWSAEAHSPWHSCGNSALTVMWVVHQIPECGRFGEQKFRPASQPRKPRIDGEDTNPSTAAYSPASTNATAGGANRLDAPVSTFPPVPTSTTHSPTLISAVSGADPPAVFLTGPCFGVEARGPRMLC